MPWKRDIATQGYPAEFVVYINMESGEDNPPGLVSRYKDPGTGKPRVITNPKELYPGAIVRASWGVYAYGGKGTDFKPGVRFGLRNLQKWADGPRLDNRVEAGDEFEGEEGEEAGADEYKDMMG
jgi:hypothetical protein